MLTHVNEKGQPTMVDVSEKTVTMREAMARCYVRLPGAIWSRFDGNEILSDKGPVFATAVIAGTMAAKKTADLIPFCHPLPITKCRINISVESAGHLRVDCTVRTRAETGVEMEALTGATIATLTIYDMCKALSHDIVIGQAMLMRKTGGKSDFVREGGHVIDG